MLKLSLLLIVLAKALQMNSPAYGQIPGHEQIIENNPFQQPLFYDPTSKTPFGSIEKSRLQQQHELMIQQHQEHLRRQQEEFDRQQEESNRQQKLRTQLRQRQESTR